MTDRFQDLFSLQVPDWIVNPFTDIVNEDIGLILQEQLIELQNDCELKPKFKNSYQDFWLQKKISECYPDLWNNVQLFFIAFPTSYLAERGFSAVANLLSKQRNRLNIVQRGDLRLLLTSIEPDIGKLVSLHQAHPSH